MTKRPIDWTDEELRKAGHSADAASIFPANWSVGWMQQFISALGAVHPAEARERQREAYRQGWLGEPTCKIGEMVMRENCNSLYPSPLPKSPPPLVLSTGDWLVRDGKWQRWRGDGMGYELLNLPSPTCKTSSDARKLADWLAEYGSEEEKRC